MAVGHGWDTNMIKNRFCDMHIIKNACNYIQMILEVDVAHVCAF